LIPKIIWGGVMAAVFVGVLVVAITSLPDRNDPEAGVTATPQVVKRGNYGRYLYGISNLTSENKKVAQFDPALPADDAVVLEALRALAKDGVGISIPEELGPAVETIDETNYVTFTVGGRKILFELFRNSSGQVGIVHFWIANNLP
jgi:hypothetical protein